MKITASHTLIDLIFALGGFTGILLFNPTINLIFGENFLVTMFRALNLFPVRNTLIILFFFLIILGFLLILIRKWVMVNINSSEKISDVTYYFILKTVSIGIVFAYLFIATAWVIVMIVLKAFLIK